MSIPDLTASPAAAPNRCDGVLVIVNHNGGAYLSKCIAAVANQTCQPHSVIVIDNASSDGSADQMLQRFPWVQLIRNERNIGFAAANNLAVQHAPATRWVITLNPDAFPEPDWLAQLTKAATQWSDYTMFACQLLVADNPSRLDGAGDCYHTSGLAWRRGHGRSVSERETSEEEVFGPCAAAAMYRRDRFLAVGGFDTDFFCYMEDVDLAFRLRLLGERCRYVPQARVLHIGSGVTGYRSDFSSYHGQRNMLWVFFKNMPMGLLLRYLPSFLVVNTVALYIGWRRKQLRIIVRAKLDALRGMRMCWHKRRLIQAQRRVSAAELVNSFERGWRSLIKR